jgi:hypothetical protein
VVGVSRISAAAFSSLSSPRAFSHHSRDEVVTIRFAVKRSRLPWLGRLSYESFKRALSTRTHSKYLDGARSSKRLTLKRDAKMQIIYRKIDVTYPQRWQHERRGRKHTGNWKQTIVFEKEGVERFRVRLVATNIFVYAKARVIVGFD